MCGGQLYRKVGCGILSKGTLIYDLDALSCCLCNEGIADDLRISIIVTVDDSYLLACHMLCDIVGGAGALVRVGEADLEYIVLVLDDICGRARRSEHKHLILCSLSGYCDGRAGGNRSYKSLHAPVNKRIVCVDCGLAVGNIILALELKLNASALSVDLVNSDLNAVEYRLTVDRSIARCRSDTTDLECSRG